MEQANHQFMRGRVQILDDHQPFEELLKRGSNPIRLAPRQQLWHLPQGNRPVGLSKRLVQGLRDRILEMP
jgi:hypothetical protein